MLSLAKYGIADKYIVQSSTMSGAHQELMNIYCLPEAFIWGYPPVISLDHKDLVGSALEQSSNYDNMDYVIDANGSSAETIKSFDCISDCAFLANLWSGNFYHWMFECLPKVVQLEQAGFSGSYIVPYLKPFIVESLGFLGVPFERIREYKSHIAVQSLFICEQLPGYKLCNFPKTFHSIRHCFLEKCQKLHSPRRLYNHRSGSRTVTNTEQLQKVIDKYDFTTAIMDNISLTEQIQSVKNLEIMIGPHGAGFVHTWFMPKNSVVIEFFSSKYINYCFRSPIELNKLLYIPLPEERMGNNILPPDHYSNANTSNINVPSHMLDLILEQCIRIRSLQD